MVILLHRHQHHLIQKGKTTPLLVRVKRNIILTFKFLGEAPTSTSQPHQYVTFYVQLSVTAVLQELYILWPGLMCVNT